MAHPRHNEDLGERVPDNGWLQIGFLCRRPELPDAIGILQDVHATQAMTAELRWVAVLANRFVRPLRPLRVVRPHACWRATQQRPERW